MGLAGDQNESNSIKKDFQKTMENNLPVGVIASKYRV
jgi:hypothetical protein